MSDSHGVAVKYQIGLGRRFLGPGNHSEARNRNDYAKAVVSLH